ncbi:MAG TPA: 30S ribosomal protein S13 [Acidobacteriota bacterium]|nr:30S ribosomal protein S13 [Acidobacteriota bacterium]
MKQEQKAPAPVAAAPAAAKAPEEKIRYIVRIANTDLDGLKPIIVALQKIKGISDSLANAICNLTGVNKFAKTGTLSDEQVKALTALIATPSKFPTWMLNRRGDYETGRNMHLITGDLTYAVENDIKRMKMIKLRRGLRHAWGLPLRGQKTRSNHRRSKSKNSSASKRGKKKSTGPAGASPKPSA